MDMNDVSERLAKAVNELGKAGFNGPALAKYCGVTPSTINRIKNKQTANPDLETVIGIASKMGVTIEELIGIDQPPKAPPQIDYDFLRKCAEQAEIGLGFLDFEPTPAVLITAAVMAYEKSIQRRKINIQELRSILADVIIDS